MKHVIEFFSIIPKALWQTCFETIWPFAFLDMDGSFLWAFAVVKVKDDQVHLRWYFSDQREDLVDMHM